MRRLIHMFLPYELDFSSVINLNSCISTLNSVGVTDRAMIIKTWLHGWATSYRIKGDHLHRCFLGCMGGRDSLSHYLLCPRMYAACCFLIPETPNDPLKRWGLVEPSRNSFLLIASIFTAYHALKHHILQRYDAGIPENCDFWHLWIFFVQSLAAESGVRGLSTKHVDPAKFDVFLNQVGGVIPPSPSFLLTP